MQHCVKHRKTDNTGLQLLDLPTEILHLIFKEAVSKYKTIEEILALRTTCHTVSWMIQNFVLRDITVRIAANHIPQAERMQIRFPVMKFALVGSDNLLQLEKLPPVHQVIFMHLTQTLDWSKLHHIPPHQLLSLL